MAKVKKAQLGSLIKAGMKAASKMVSKAAPKSAPKAAAKTTSRITDDEMRAAVTQHQRNLMKSRFKELDKAMEKKRSGGKVSKPSKKK